MRDQQFIITFKNNDIKDLFGKNCEIKHDFIFINYVKVAQTRKVDNIIAIDKYSSREIFKNK